MPVGHLLHLVLRAALVVLRDLFFLERFLKVMDRVAAQVTDRDARVFRLVLDNLGELLAPLLGEHRHRHAHRLAARCRVEAEVRIADRLLHRLRHLLFKRRDPDGARIDQGHARHLVERRLGAVVVDGYVIEQARVRAAGAHLGEIGLERLDALVHLLLGAFLEFRDHAASAKALTSYVNQSALVLSADHPAQRVALENAEHVDRQFLVAAQRQRGGIHHLEVARDRLVEADPAVALRARVALRVGGVDAVDLGALEHDLGPDLAAAQRRRGVGGEERIAGARGEHHDLALLEVADRLAADIGLDHLLDVERGERAARQPGDAHRVLKRERVHHRGEHSHVVGGGAVHPGRARRHAPEDIAAADHHADLHAQARDLRDLADDGLDGLAVDAESIFPHQRFARQFEENALVLGSQCAFPACAITSAAKSPDFFSMPSPTTKKAYALTLAFSAASIFSTVCLSSRTKGWPSSVLSFRNLLSAPSTILATISAGFPDSLARASWMRFSSAAISCGISALLRYAGLAKAMCIARSLPTPSGPS